MNRLLRPLAQTRRYCAAPVPPPRTQVLQLDQPEFFLAAAGVFVGMGWEFPSLLCLCLANFVNYPRLVK
jgi:hypothetical protein